MALMLVMLLCMAKVCFGCQETLSPVYAIENADVAIQFRIDVPTGSSIVFYRVNLNETYILGVTYSPNSVKVDASAFGVTFIGNASTGNISFTISGISSTRSGIYHFGKQGALALQCVSVYILGKPTTPHLSSGSIPEIGGDMTFTCSSQSNTVPADHDLKLTYSWFMNQQSIPSDGRFTYNGNSLTISNIQENDKGTSVACKANETVKGGLISDMSNLLQIDVAYGPNKIRFRPVNNSYTLNSGATLPNVTCEADCNPNCTFVWYKGDVNHQSTPTLSLGTLGIDDAATYICQVSRSGRISKMNLTINVVYGPLNIMPSSGSVFVGDISTNISITPCSSRCWECTYTWTGPVNKTGRILSIDHLQKNHAGSYRCTVMNTRSIAKMTTDINIKVRYGPDTVTLSPSGQIHTVNETGHLDNIECHAECYPNCTYVWRKSMQDEPVANNNTLPLGYGMTREHAGKYTCSATNPDRAFQPSATATVSINVNYGPDKVSLQPAVLFYTKNESETLNNIICTADCYPTCSIMWMKNNKVYPSNSVLSLGQLDALHAGNYSCIATNTQMHGTAQTVVTVNVRYGPNQILFKPQVSSPLVLVEDSYHQDITCSSICYPSCLQSWNTSGFTEAVLPLGKVSRSDTGTYNCKSSNEAKEYTKEMNKVLEIIIQYPPDITITIAYANESTTIKCSAKGEPREYKFEQWIHIAPDNVTEVQRYAGESNGSESTLVLKYPTYMDSGFYICTVSNLIKTPTMDSKQLRIKGKPYVIDGKREFDAKIHDNISIAVEVYSVDFYSLNITWFKVTNKTNDTIDSGSQRYNASVAPETVMVPFYTKNVYQPGYRCQLDIQDIREDEITEYDAKIENNEGFVVVKLFIKPRGPPENPSNFGVIPNSQTTSTISFVWYPGFNGGANQTFHIEYKLNMDSTEGKHPDWIGGTDVFGGTVRMKQFTTTVNGLEPGSSYLFRIYASNKFGNSSNDNSLMGNTTIKEEVSRNAPSLVGPGVGAGLGTAVVILMVIVGVVFVRRKKMQGQTKGSLEKNEDSNDRQQLHPDDDLEINMNPMYESAGPNTGASGDTNADVKKPKTHKKENAPDDNKYLYAEVKKTTTKQENNMNPMYESAGPNTGATGDTNADVKKPKTHKKENAPDDNKYLYAEVKKTTTKQEPTKKDKKDKKQNVKRAKKVAKKAGPDSVYENADPLRRNDKAQENVYENPSCSTADEESKKKSPKRLPNADGLIYVQLDLPKQNEKKGAKLYIHGNEDRTDYADIAFGKVGEQMPDSDEDDKDGKDNVDIK